MKKKGKATVDVISNASGQFRAFGSTASRLLANGMNIAALRTNDVLLYDEWKQIDRAVLMAYQERLVGVADLLSRNLTYNIPNGLGKTVLGTQVASDLSAAQISMDGVTRATRDRMEFDIEYLPLPIIHKDFSFSIREIEAARSGGLPLDTSMAAACARQVGEMAETILFQGASSYTLGGGTIYGYEDAPNRNSGSLNAPWNDSAASGATILADVLAMKQALIAAKCYGPYALYAPTQYETSLDDDFKAASDKSVRGRLMEVSNLASIKIADMATATKVTMAQLTSDVVRIVNGLAITTVQWETEGGMKVNFKVMAIQIPQIRSDKSGNCGVAVYSE